LPVAAPPARRSAIASEYWLSRRIVSRRRCLHQRLGAAILARNRQVARRVDVDERRVGDGAPARTAASIARLSRRPPPNLVVLMGSMRSPPAKAARRRGRIVEEVTAR
jgi:hypothetical protein